MDIKPLIIDATNETPEVILDPYNNEFKIEGNSYPENTAKFYSPILEWLGTFKEQIQTNERIEFNFSLDYFNTSSAKYILEILRVIEEIRNKGIDVIIKWHYLPDDTDMLESGQDYENSVNLPFEFVEREEEEDEDDDLDFF